MTFCLTWLLGGAIFASCETDKISLFLFLVSVYTLILRVLPVVTLVESYSPVLKISGFFFCDDISPIPESRMANSSLSNTVKNTAISPNFLVWKFCGKAQLLHRFGRFARNYARNCAFPQNFHIRKLGEITVFYAVRFSNFVK